MSDKEEEDYNVTVHYTPEAGYVPTQQDSAPNDGSVYISSTGHYDVYVSDGGYSVRNTSTRVTEYESRSLPQSIGVAEQYDYMLENDTWQEVMVGMFENYQVPVATPHLSAVPTQGDDNATDPGLR